MHEPSPLRPLVVLALLAPASAALRFDHILVGGGTAGCCLADRLSAAGKHVLLLEPGPSPRGSLTVAAPVGITKLFFSVWDWGFGSRRSEKTAGRSLHLARGKALGGSSCTNAMLYHRGTAADYDGWRVAGWDSSAMLRGFKRSEGNRRDSLADSPWHSASGPVSVEDARYANPLSRSFLLAAVQAGAEVNPDFNDWSRSQEGVGVFQITAARGRREIGRAHV